MESQGFSACWNALCRGRDFFVKRIPVLVPNFHVGTLGLAKIYVDYTKREIDEKAKTVHTKIHAVISVWS